MFRIGKNLKETTGFRQDRDKRVRELEGKTECVKSERNPAGSLMRFCDPSGGGRGCGMAKIFPLCNENERICLIAKAMARGQQRDGGAHDSSRWKGANLGTVCGQHLKWKTLWAKRKPLKYPTTETDHHKGSIKNVHVGASECHIVTDKVWEVMENIALKFFTEI